jgi:transcriptional regulator with XRE-family HTH domain
LESLGNKLQSARKEKGWTFSDVSSETNIASRYLEALEKEDFSVFPGEPYALGFLKNYGDHLGIDPEELLSLYRSMKIREQPVPMEQLLKKRSKAPKVFGRIAASLVILAIIGAAIFFLLERLPKGIEPAPITVRTASEYVLNADFLERRLYPGDSILVTAGNNSFKLVFSSLDDAVTIVTPGGPVLLDLGQEVTIDLNNSGFPELRIIAADFVKNDSMTGALLRFEQELPPQTVTVTPTEIPLETFSAGREEAALIFSSPNPFPFTLQAVFQGFCLFRYEILFERDRPGRNEQYYQRSEEINLTAQNGIRLGISNARATKLQVIGGGRTVPFDAGGPGEVVAADLRWVRDEENRYRLVLIRLE